MTTCAHMSAANESARLSSLAAARRYTVRAVHSRRNGDGMFDTPVSNVPSPFQAARRLDCRASGQWWCVSSIGPENFIGEAGRHLTFFPGGPKLLTLRCQTFLPQGRNSVAAAAASIAARVPIRSPCALDSFCAERGGRHMKTVSEH
jgi:hypothetical protein